MPYKKKKEYTPGQLIVFLFLLLMIGVTLLFANSIIKRRQSLSTSAAAGNAQLFFEPNSLTLPPDSRVNLWVTTDKPTAFVHAEFTFDPKLVKLTQEVTLTNTSLPKIQKVTPMSEANTTGRVSITVGADPVNKSAAPTGSFALATVTLQPVSTATGSLVLNYDTTKSQLVDTGAVPFTVTATTGSLALNPVASPSPVASVIANSDTIIPTVSITNPANGSTVNKKSTVIISATATDNVGIAKVVFLVNGSVKCTDTAAPYSCSYAPNGKSGTADTLTARAYDPAGNQASQTIQVTKQ